MKLKKEYIILLLVIVALSLYLTMRSKDQTHFELPQLDAVDGKTINRLVITRAGDTIELDRKDDQWFLAPRQYRADSIKVNNMTKALADLAVTALVSESQSYQRYDLDDAQKIGIQALAGQKMVRQLDVGRLAPTNQHTFIKLQGDPNVYHARGNIQRTFDQTVAQLRDETVLNFEKDAITALRIQRGGQALELKKTAKPEAEPAEGDQEQAEPSPSEDKPEFQWLDAEGRPAKSADVTKIMNSFFSLKCNGYMADDAKPGLKDPAWTVSFASDSETFSLSVFAPASAEADEYPAISTGSDYAFLLAKNRVETFEKQLEALLPSKDDENADPN